VLHNRFSGKLAVIAGFVVLCATTLVLGASDDLIRDRIKPAGEVCLVGDACAAAAGITVAGATAAAAMNPDQVYNTYCFACHGTGANNAPVMGDSAAWAPRIAKGIDVLYDSVINGFNGGVMPAKGLCMSCSDADLQATVDYMIKDL
jgi:cytochrome c5